MLSFLKESVWYIFRNENLTVQANTLLSLCRITSTLGSGQFGEVRKGIWQSPMGGMDVAVKQLQPGATEEEKVKFLQEAAMNGQFRHPNVVKLMGVVTVGEPVSQSSTIVYIHFITIGETCSDHDSTGAAVKWRS